MLPLVTDALEAYIYAWQSSDPIPGLALGVSHENNSVFEHYAGVSNLELLTPVTSDTVFEIASVAKQFCVAAVLQLVQAGRVRLNDPIMDYFSGERNTWPSVTIRHLLTHTSGIVNYFDLPPDRIPTAETVEEFIEYLNGLPLEFQPGEKWSYSNTGYLMLAQIVAQVTGQTYESYLEEHLFKPLGLASTQLLDNLKIIPRRAAGYLHKNGTWQNRTGISSRRPLPGPSGMLSSMSDMLKWANVWSTGTLIEAELVEEMWRPHVLSGGLPVKTMFLDSEYGYGWCLSDRAGVQTCWTPGAASGFTSIYVCMPDHNIAVIGLCNGSKFPDFNWFNQAILRFAELAVG